MFVGIPVIKISTYYSIEYGVAQKLESLIVGPSAVGCLHRHGAVHKSQLIVLDVKRIEPCYAMNKNIKFLFLSEKELYD